MATTKPVPDRYHTITPHIVCKPAAKAIEFYAKAFGAEDQGQMLGPDGLVMHAEIKIGDSVIMLSDEMEGGGKSPVTLGGNHGALMIYVENVDKAFERAIAAGAKVDVPLENQFWGDRYGRVLDPFGHKWALATHIEDVSMEEMERRMAKMSAGGGGN
jgi:PhnB protein